MKTGSMESDTVSLERKRGVVVAEINLHIASALIHLAQYEKHAVNREEMELLRLSCEALDSIKDEFIELFDSLDDGLLRQLKKENRFAREDHFSVWDYLYFVIPTIASIASIVDVSDFGRRTIEIQRILQMRLRKKEKRSNAEAALIDAIRAERGEGTVRRPYKEAVAILDAVNRRMEATGLEPVKVDVVRRRLEKWSALLETAEKAPK
jgi:hypothetical protein